MSHGFQVVLFIIIYLFLIKDAAKQVRQLPVALPGLRQQPIAVELNNQSGKRMGGSMTETSPFSPPGVAVFHVLNQTHLINTFILCVMNAGEM